jgi:hypothetical protein
MSEQKAKAARYRQEAAEIRRATKLIKDERFRDQLLSIADELEAFANSLEAGIQSKNDC